MSTETGQTQIGCVPLSLLATAPDVVLVAATSIGREK
jgi:hypothetical protein